MQIKDSPIYLVFEHASDALLYRHILEVEGFRVLPIEELLEQCLGERPLTKTAQLNLISELTSHHLLPDDLHTCLDTLTCLRGSLILTPQHIEHAFSLFPSNPQTQLLKALLLQLAECAFKDQPQLLWDGQQKITQLSFSKNKKDKSEYIFIQLPNSSFLFEQFAQHFAVSNPAIRYTRLCELPSASPSNQPFPKTPDFLHPGSPHELALELCSTLVRNSNIKNSIQNMQYLCFSGSATLKWCLSLILKQAGIDLLDPKIYPNTLTNTFSYSDPVTTQFEAFCNHVKTFDWPLLEKLVFVKTLWKIFRQRRPTQSLDSLFTHFIQSDSLSPKEKAAVKTFTQDFSLSTIPKPVPSNHDSQKQVQLLPPYVLPPLSETPLCYLIEGASLDASLPTSWLTEVDLFTLSQNGYRVPQASTLQNCLIQDFKLLSDGRAPLYTDLLGVSATQTTIQPSHSNPTPLPHSKTECPLPTPQAQSLEPLLTSPLPPRETPLSHEVMPLALSASQLETYADCPAKYFYSYIAKLRPDVFREDRYALYLGLTTHGALEDFFRQFPDRFFDNNPNIFLENISSTLPLLFQSNLTKYCGDLEMSDPLFKSLQYRLKSYLPIVLDLESQLSRFFGVMKTIAVEKDFTVNISGVTLTGKIDRIDMLNDGTLLILDYKTGTVDFSPNHIRQGKHFQSLIYWLAVQTLYTEPISGILFYDLKTKEIRRGLGLKDRLNPEAAKSLTRNHAMSLEQLQDLLVHGTAHIQSIADKIKANQFDATPSPSICGYCPYATHCRKAATYV